MNSSFTGIPRAAFDFYAELEDDNSKAFWSAHLDTYENQVRGPMSALLAELAGEFGPGGLFRPNRDLRFGTDKRPYKEHQGAFIKTGDANGFYAQFSADGLLIGGGWYSGTSDQVARYRAAVAGPAGEDLAGIAEQLLAQGWQLEGDRLKTRPRGVPADHPRLGLLRHRTLYASLTIPSSTAWLAEPEAADVTRKRWREVSGLIDWLDAYVTGGPVGMER
ncbi:MAG: DUF2461 domain-containing protein [Candidatus Nanopelagicales bacterium]